MKQKKSRKSGIANVVVARKSKRRSGFTLIELLVVIAVISILSSIVLVSLRGIQHRARVGKVRAELDQIRKVINILEIDTAMGPNHTSIEPCVQTDSAISLDSCAAGIQCTDGNFLGWKGPYMNVVPKDPWGTYYYFDANYRCLILVDGCEGVPDNTWVRAVVSFGPNKTEEYGGDDIVLILCR